MLRMAGTLCYLDWAMVGGAEPERIECGICSSRYTTCPRLLLATCRAALRQIGLSERHANARRVLRWIKTHGKDEISREEIRREALGQSLDADQTQHLLGGLVQSGWLRKICDQHSRPCAPSVASKSFRFWHCGKCGKCGKGVKDRMRWDFPHFPHFPQLNKRPKLLERKNAKTQAH